MNHKPGIPERAPEPLPEILLLPRSPLRCPFCHDHCHPAGAVVCQVCVGRHHAECWDEHGACAACGSGHRLVPETAEWQRTDEELYELIRQGRREEVEAHVERCWHTIQEVRMRATQLAIEKFADELARRQKLEVVGPRAPRSDGRVPYLAVGALLLVGVTAAPFSLITAAIAGAAFVVALGAVATTAPTARAPARLASQPEPGSV